MDHAEWSADSRDVRELVIAFIDLTFFTKDAAARDEPTIAAVIDEYYERVGEAVAGARGVVIKFMGDGALIAFPPERADDALGTFGRLRRDIDAWLGKLGWASRLTVKLHTGPVIAGGYGPRGHKRFDVIGNTVNVAARLPRPFHVTPQFFRLLSPENRKILKKHTPPVTYIPVDDRH